MTKTSILSILDNFEVCVEFVKKFGSPKRELVYEVLRISPDGQRIVLYEPGSGCGGVPPASKPPDLPQQGADQIYSFDNLPEKYWKKYMHAYKFVDLIRKKTVKVTYYTDKAKCMLMETVVDFEACFYNGMCIFII